jgi:hypothetical protein
VRERFYQYLPASGDPAALCRHDFRKTLRKQLRLADDAGYTFNTTREPGAVQLEYWYSHVLSPRLVQLGAAPFTLDFYRSIFTHLGSDGDARFSWIADGDTMVGGGIFLDGWCHDIYLRATTEEGMANGAGYLLDYESMLRAGQNGTAYHNFQSSPSRESSAYEYKRRWGCLEGTTAYYTRVLTDIRRITRWGLSTIKSVLPGWYVLPYEVYEETK